MKINVFFLVTLWNSIFVRGALRDLFSFDSLASRKCLPDDPVQTEGHVYSHQQRKKEERHVARKEHNPLVRGQRGDAACKRRWRGLWSCEECPDTWPDSGRRRSAIH